MAPPPAVIIVVRHGARLDQADSQWHLTSPTPYDPPLTYGGWTQARALGVRIATLLHARETASSPRTNGGGIKSAPGAHRRPSADRSGDRRSDSPHQHQHQRTKKTKAHKVIIHSSPFLRCLQTSVAISAGMSQQYAASAPQIKEPHPSKAPRLYGRPHNAPSNNPTHHFPGQTGERFHTYIVPDKFTKKRRFRKPILRVDACLGEWLTPGYYDLIVPPPDSKLMVAAAKAELMRRESYSTAIETDLKNSSATSNKSFPGGWGSNTTATAEQDSAVEDGALETITELGEALTEQGMRSRANSTNTHMTMKSKSEKALLPLASPTTAPPEDGSYVAPTPAYALSPNDPIPLGYTTHARDACVEMDYQWDSMKSPQNWGDGGELGEEWPSMQKRFRNALKNVMEWYSKDGKVTESSTEKTNGINDPINLEASHSTSQDTEEEEEDLVVILVTHGAGCNALVGGLTGQPWLTDFGVASLTMALRKDILDPAADPPSSSVDLPPISSQRGSGFGQTYDVRLIASTDHLRAGSNPSSISSLSSSNTATPVSPIPQYRHRYNSMSDPSSSGPTIAHKLYTPRPRGASATTSPTSAERNYTTAPSSFSSSSSTQQQRPLRSQTIAAAQRSSSSGLWGSAVSTRDSDASEDSDGLGLLDFNNRKEGGMRKRIAESTQGEKASIVGSKPRSVAVNADGDGVGAAANRTQGKLSGGLWGATTAKMPDGSAAAAGGERRRRWTTATDSG